MSKSVEAALEEYAATHPFSADSHEVSTWLENWPNSNCDFWVFYGDDETKIGTLHVYEATNKWSFFPSSLFCLLGTGASETLKGKLNGSLHDVKVLERIRQEIGTWLREAMRPSKLPNGEHIG